MTRTPCVDLEHTLAKAKFPLDKTRFLVYTVAVSHGGESVTQPTCCS